jgi:ABC-2 family transporter protein
MIWMTWRQFRAQAIVAGALIAVVAVALLISGLNLASAYNAAGLNSCHATCPAEASNFTSALRGSGYQLLFYGGIGILYLAPALIGLFWGAPLIARELETGTYRLSWNQSVSRNRWVAAKLGIVGLAAVVTTGLVSLMVSWWASPIDEALSLGSQSGMIGNRLSPVVFAARGVVPLGYAAFAFALGVTLGVLIRRTLPAMALTLAIFAAVQILVPNFVRPHLISPETTTAPLNVSTAAIDMTQQGNSATMNINGNFSKPGTWILSDQSILPSGQVFTGPATQACLGPNGNACNNWLASKHLRQFITYQPASRFWPLQWTETAMYLAASAGLGGICIWRIRRKRA